MMLSRAEITHSKNQENQFKQTLALLNAVIESTTDGILVVDDKEKIVTYNQNFVKICRIPKSVLRLHDVSKAHEFVANQLKHPEKLKVRAQEFYSNPLAESFDTLEFKDERIIERYSKPQIVNNKAVGRVCSFRDVTSLKLIEKNLEDSRDYYLSIINSVNDYIIVLDRTGHIKYINHVVPGIKSKEMVGSNWLDWVAPACQALAKQAISDVAATGKSNTIELRAIGANLVMAWYQVKISCIPSSATVEMSLVATDITEQKFTEKKLKLAKLSAERANQAKSTFLANMSHEIRTPLAAVMGFADLITNTDITESEKQNYGAAIKRNGELLSNIISDILDLSKIEVEKFNLDSLDVSLDEVLSDLDILLSFKANEKALNFTFTFEGQIPKIIKTDPLRLRQILLNVIGNSIKFTEHGTVDVAVRLLPADNKPPQLAFIVKDTGIGISQEQSAKLFQPFSQADASILGKYGGTGLGLILSRRLANLLGGDVVLTESTHGKGSTFTITIDPGPLQNSQLLDYVNKKKSVHVVPVPNPAAILENFRVLVVDDSVDNQLLISKVLKLAGAEIDTADNGKKALEIVTQKKYDLLLVDLQMPVLDGYETTAQLRKEGYKTPIIALTAHALKEIRQRCLESGFDDFITKPVDRNALINKIAYYIKKSAPS